uniref:Uncharacterized protein n=1 Tax=uncultured marine group II/III euryarchaeote KM3_99_A09 TaxID=1456549 RepID=A0A075I3A3_9EURY|nr:hypothetical protein [uncultured marine group II/III euryarchaeote KM3_99_A09]
MMRRFVRAAMSDPRATLTVAVRPSDDPERVAEAVNALFPDLEPPDLPELRFPGMDDSHIWQVEGVDLRPFLEQIEKQRIMDTALDAMALDLTSSNNSANDETVRSDTTKFSLSRQAALAGKVAFVLPGERALGGTMKVGLEGAGLAEWIEKVTWHPGRREIPRSISDDVAMRADGEVTEWFDEEPQY